jgi:hypothetical protein
MTLFAGAIERAGGGGPSEKEEERGGNEGRTVVLYSVQSR